MLNLSLGWGEYETDLSGEKVKMELKALSPDAFLKLLPVISKLHDDADTAKTSLLAEAQLVAGAIFGGHVRNISGVTVDGQPATVEQLASEYVFSGLCFDILSELISRTNIDRASGKNLPSPLPDMQQGQG